MAGACVVTPDIRHVFGDWTRYNGVCRKCRRALSIFAQRANHRDPEHGWATGYLDGQGRLWRMGQSSAEPIVDCPSCGKLVTLHAVNGKLNPSKICSGKCMCATGPSCECACGGANHGAGNSF